MIRRSYLRELAGSDQARTQLDDELEQILALGVELLGKLGTLRVEVRALRAQVDQLSEGEDLARQEIGAALAAIDAALGEPWADGTRFMDGRGWRDGPAAGPPGHGSG